MFPSSVDLRSEYDAVYSQGSDSSCGPHALTAALDCMFERATGRPHRFDTDHLWRWAKWHNGILSTENRGIDRPSLCKALNINGAKIWQRVITGFSMVETRLRLMGVDHFKHLLCLGIPMVYAMRMPLNLASLTGDWRKHTLELDKSGSQDRDHFVCVVGYDDAAQRFLFENSWGGWGDGGFFGVPYSQMGDPNLFRGLCHVDVLPIIPKPVEGYTMPAPYLTPSDQTAFVDRVGPALKNQLMTAFEAGGIDSIISECKKWGVSDKHLEVLLGAPRGSVRQIKVEQPGHDWDGFIWDQL